ncbi:Uncharacterized protein SCG7086_AL_00090 [Chlamydiales bacterium SCGC AG-110-P3]|nr:Uncharacterized protein SCG7086_AL_00090 [Chlamydiales bacterium SCGC AG-110-P3]
MFFQSRDPQQHANDNARTINELAERNAQFDDEAKELLASLEVSPEQINALLKDSTQFTPNNWQQIQEQVRLLDEKIECEIANVPDPIRATNARNEQNIQQHWMFIK